MLYIFTQNRNHEYQLIPSPILKQIQASDVSLIPALFAKTGEEAKYRFIEFFTANIQNPNTCQAYCRAIQRFSGWCEECGLELTTLNPVSIPKYIQELGEELSRPSVKQHLVAIRMLFDYLVTVATSSRSIRQ